jgi:hypothetical protein
LTDWNSPKEKVDEYLAEVSQVGVNVGTAFQILWTFFENFNSFHHNLNLLFQTGKQNVNLARKIMPI